jgi:hypothetical protein
VKLFLYLVTKNKNMKNMKNMKNIKLIFAISTLFISCHNFAQVGVVRPLNYYSETMPNGTYIKDISNSFAPFIGNWQVSWNGKTITFFISKVTKNRHSYPNGDYFYEDRVIAKYIIVDNLTGAELQNTTSITNFDDQKIFNIGYVKNLKFSLYLIDKDLCGYGGEIYLRQDPNNPNIMNYGFMYERDYILPLNCSFQTIASIPIPIPTISLVLIKI